MRLIDELAQAARCAYIGASNIVLWDDCDDSVQEAWKRVVEQVLATYAVSGLRKHE